MPLPTKNKVEMFGLEHVEFKFLSKNIFSKLNGLDWHKKEKKLYTN